MTIYTWNGKIIRTPTGGIANNINCCCEQELCPCLTGPLKNPITLTWTRPPAVGAEIHIPCFYDPDVFFGEVELCTSSACVSIGRFCDQSIWPLAAGGCVPPYDSCAKYDPPTYGCCETKTLSVPNPGWGNGCHPGHNPEICDCVPRLGDLCIDGSIENSSACYTFQLSVNCSDPNNIRSTLSYGVDQGCPPRIQAIAQWTLDHGPGPIDPALVLGTYTCTPGGNFQPPPLPVFPYGNFLILPQQHYDITAGYVMTLS